MVEVSIGMNFCESCFLHVFLYRLLITMIFSVNTYTSFLGEFFCQYSLFLEVEGGSIQLQCNLKIKAVTEKRNIIVET